MDKGGQRPDGPAEPDILEELEAEVSAELAEEAGPRGGPAYQVVGALVALVLGVAGAVLSWGYGLNTPSDPGPGLWPFVISLVIVVLSVMLLFSGRGLRDAEAFSRSSVQPAIGAVTLLGLAVLMPRIGFEIPSVLMCLVWTRFLGGETWRSSLVVSVLAVAGFHLVFIEALGVPLPRLI